jgi:predicted TIM-barrel fold metal-dependent hydrolase
MTSTLHHIDDEEPLDPGRVIVDPHHHLWDHGRVPGASADLGPFLLPQMLQTIADAGHNVTHTVFVESQAMYRKDGPEELRPVGEVEFANGVAAMAASGRYGDCRLAAGIVGIADLTRGARAAPALEAMIRAGNGRLKGVRARTAYVDCTLFGSPPDPRNRGVMKEAAFQQGVRSLAGLGLRLDIWCFHPQIPELADVAAACPDTIIILDHLGTPFLFGPYRDQEREVFDDWRNSMAELARRSNVRVKLGGLGLDLTPPLSGKPGRGRSLTQASTWRPYIETCIELFGPQRCMFESNFPPDIGVCSYGALWNTFKIIASGYSEDEKVALFSGTAKEVYGLD